MKVYINQRSIDGIKRVIEAQVKHLPEFGVEVTNNINEADVICNHGTAAEEKVGVPSVHVGHGFMWSRQPWGDGYMEVNRDVVDSMKRAVAHTAPSKWVATAIRRGGFFYPEVVYHGVDASDFKRSNNEGYVLWNKARADFVSDPGDMIRVAELAKNMQFLSTLGSQNRAFKHPPNLRIIGAIPYQRMKEVVSNAGVYLATARETFGIGTLEALACGIPVAGWDWGGQSEIIINGVTGYLARPGDFKGLQDCIERCMAERDRLSDNAISDVRDRWKWEPRIEQYANIFKRVYQNWYSEGPKVSIIVTAYKLDQYLPMCLESIMKQTFSDFECIVVDDANMMSTKIIVEKYADRDKRIKYRPTPSNMGLPGARNYGLSISSGKYIRHVDADDFLAPNAIELETTALDTDSSSHIVYGHLEVVRTDGSRVIDGSGDPVRGGWPPPKYNWYQQMAHLNQLPSCVMARREVYEKSGGYRERMKRNEDAEFWCRVTSLGFKATKFTEAVTYFHRERHDSKGAVEWQEQGAEPDWTAWFPWRMGSSNFDQARDILRKRGEVPKNIYLVPFGAQGKPNKLPFWYVHDYAYPIVSIIVTCGPGHRKYLLDALDSIQGQTYPDWECIVVNDTGEKWNDEIMGAPWAKVVNMDGNRGVSAARNEGLKHARGRYVAWMDADDYWLPWFLEKTMTFADHNHGVIYSDIILDENGKYKVNKYQDFDSTRVISKMQYPGSSVIVPMDIAQTMVEFQGGFDEQIPGMEDWDYQIAVHHLGYCAYHIPEPLFVYRMHTSTKRDRDYAKIDEIVGYVDRKWSSYRTGEKTIMCGCSTLQPPNQVPATLLQSSGNFTEASIKEAIDTNDKTMMVTVEYVGEMEAPFSVKSRVSPGVVYRFGNSDGHRIKSVFVGDAVFLSAMNDSQGNPKYRMVSNIAKVDAYDPAAFIGQPITA